MYQKNFSGKAARRFLSAAISRSLGLWCLFYMGNEENLTNNVPCYKLYLIIGGASLGLTAEIYKVPEMNKRKAFRNKYIFSLEVWFKKERGWGVRKNATEEVG